MRGFVALFSFFVAMSTAASDVPQQLHYNGYLTNAVGEAVDCPDAIQCAESYDLRFRLYGAAEGGSPIWEETYEGIEIFSGSFHSVLGSINPITSALLDGPTWLAVKVNDIPEMLPRQKLVSGAYALRSGHAEQATEAVNATQLGGVNADDYALAAELSTEDNDALGALICAEGMIAKMSALGWACGLDETGGVDTTLSEEEVDAMVANNGYSTGDHTVDTTLSEAEVDGLVANNGYAAQVDLDTTNGTITSVQSDLADAQANLALLQTSLTSLETTVGSQGTDLATLQTSVGDIQITLTTVAADIATLQTDLANAQAEVAALQTAGFQIPDDPEACSEIKSGTLRWHEGIVEVCDGTDWVAIYEPPPPPNGTSALNAGVSCKSILDAGFSAGDGLYWIDPDGAAGLGPREAYCDMGTDEGGWTLAMRRVGAEWQETWMHNSWGTGALPTQSNTNDTSWKVPDNATRIRYSFTSSGNNTPTDYVITSAPGSPDSDTGMWFTAPGTGDFPVTLFHNSVQGLASSNIQWNFKLDGVGATHGCYGVSSNKSYTESCDHTNQLFGAIYDGCGGTNNTEIYIGSRKDIVGSGAGGAYCTSGDANARWWIWWRDD
jgi:hypothetical protein